MESRPSHLGQVGRCQLLGGAVRHEVLEERIDPRQLGQVLLGGRELRARLGPPQFDPPMFALELREDRLQCLPAAAFPDQISPPLQTLLAFGLEHSDLSSSFSA